MVCYYVSRMKHFINYLSFEILEHTHNVLLLIFHCFDAISFIDKSRLEIGNIRNQKMKEEKNKQIQ